MSKCWMYTYSTYPVPGTYYLATYYLPTYLPSTYTYLPTYKYGVAIDDLCALSFEISEAAAIFAIWRMAIEILAIWNQNWNT